MKWLRKCQAKVYRSRKGKRCRVISTKHASFYIYKEQECLFFFKIIIQYNIHKKTVYLLRIRGDKFFTDIPQDIFRLRCGQFALLHRSAAVEVAPLQVRRVARAQEHSRCSPLVDTFREQIDQTKTPPEKEISLASYISTLKKKNRLVNVMRRMQHVDECAYNHSARMERANCNIIVHAMELTSKKDVAKFGTPV